MRATSLVFLAASMLASGGESRVWTEETSRRMIEGKIDGKKADNSSVRIIPKAGPPAWLETAKLVKADQDYVKAWVDLGVRLEARVIASGKGWKDVEVKYWAGASPSRIHAHDTWPDRRRGPIRRQVKPEESGSFTYRAHNEYRVIAYVGDKEVARETDKRKTGL